MGLRTRPWLGVLEGRVTPATFTVSNTADSGMGSLRQAVADANGLAGSDTIIFDSGVFNAQKSIVLTTGQLVVSTNTTINGPISGVIINGNKNDRVFQLDSTSANSFTMSRLTITSGK